MIDLASYISLSSMLVLATIDENGSPYTANVYFKYDEQQGKFYICSNARRNHSQHVMSNEHVAWSILDTNKYSLKDGDKKGLQFQGISRVLTGKEKAEIHKKYFEEFDSLEHMNEIGQELYECNPTQVKIWDEEKYGGEGKVLAV